MGSRFDFILQSLTRHKAGVFGSAFFFLFALLWVRYGFWRTIFIYMMSAIGYFVFEKILANRERLERLLDRIFPEGRIR